MFLCGLLVSWKFLRLISKKTCSKCYKQKIAEKRIIAIFHSILIYYRPDFKVGARYGTLICVK